MTACARVRCEGSVHVPLAPADAFALFTPSGERRWVDGWDPWFPAPADHETRPGTVFQTKHGHPTTWIVVACAPGRSITYCRVSEAGHAGLIEVSCEPDPEGGTTAAVVYDLTALDQQGACWLREFAGGYEQYLAHWRHAIGAALAR